MKGYIGVVFALYIACSVATQQCSKYHYEEQILSKVVRLEHRLDILEEKLSKEDNNKDMDNQLEDKACTQCPDGWIQYAGSCYMIMEEKLSFDEARASCLKLNADLVHIENARENTFLRNHLRTLKGTAFWIGLTDTDTEGVFKWVDDNSKASFTDWDGGQPDDYGSREDCAQFYADYDLKWNDGRCFAILQSICEMKVKV
ncbi:perlucin-like protein [Ruditapes philippinarum]|uniref:perlucin-like protein n=1 Tax=Ruditapes philippinarum TaxID=129788 RepID=UPI00295B571F|nr:perlucin-like protein [Ruditapes philippinarum]